MDFMQNCSNSPALPISMIFAIQLSISSYQDVWSVCPHFDSGLALWLVFGRRIWQKWRCAKSKYEYQTPHVLLWALLEQIWTNLLENEKHMAQTSALTMHQSANHLRHEWSHSRLVNLPAKSQLLQERT